VRSFAPAALQPERSRDQHDMRIAAKRLRYVLELTGFCFDEPARTAQRQARELQEVLGEIHDCDVMLPRIEAHLVELRSRDAAAVRRKAGEARDLDPALVSQTRHRTSYPGLAVLAVFVEARRQLLFDRFKAVWEEQEASGSWGRLEQSVESRLRAEMDAGATGTAAGESIPPRKDGGRRS
jgi:hypothetical protein